MCEVNQEDRCVALLLEPSRRMKRHDSALKKT